MSVYKRKNRWYFDRVIDGHRYRRVIPEARTKAEALQAEAHIVNQLFKKKYDPQAQRKLFTAFVNETFLPYSKTNKRSHYDDRLTVKVLASHFESRYLDEITPAMVEAFKQERSRGLTKKGTPRKPATVNRE